MTRGLAADPALAVRARAPIRLDLAGGWTDVPPFSTREGGVVVNLAVNRYAYATVRHRPQGIRLDSADYGTAVEVSDLDELRYDGTLDLLKAALRLALPPAGQRSGGLAIFTRSDAPPGSGTGGSAAAAVALVGAVARATGQWLTAHEAARLAWQAERLELGVAGGTQDQFAAAYGGANAMTIQDDAVAVSPLRLAPDTVAELEKRLVLCYSGHSRLSGDVIDVVMGAYREGRASTVNALRTLRRLAGEAKDALLAGDVDRLANLLSANWRCQRDLHPAVTTPEIERLMAVAATAGARGGKALGAGGGGCLAFIAAPDSEGQLRTALAGAGAQLMDVGIDRHGLHTWCGPA
jgi:D-glycero-alpha-D-manno-heptose-7-phosphate kinase